MGRASLGVHGRIVCSRGGVRFCQRVVGFAQRPVLSGSRGSERYPSYQMSDATWAISGSVWATQLWQFAIIDDYDPPLPPSLTTSANAA
jgi:hypothetical protein